MKASVKDLKWIRSNTMYNMNKKKMKKYKAVNPINRSSMDDSQFVIPKPKSAMDDSRRPKRTRPLVRTLEQSMDKGVQKGLKNFRVR